MSYRFLYDFNLMRTSEPVAQFSPGISIRVLLSAFAECAVTKRSRLITTWPRRIESPAILHQMAVLWHVVGIDDQEQIGVQAEDLSRLSTLVWPFSNISMKTMDGVLADRRLILRHIKHRFQNKLRCNACVIQLRRLIDVKPNMAYEQRGNQMALEECIKLQHPSLAEIAPILLADGEGNLLHKACRAGFLRRIRKYTQITTNEIPDDLFNMGAAPYLLFGLPVETNMRRVLREIYASRRPDVVIIDISALARHFGDAWVDKTSEFLRIIRTYSLSENTEGVSVPPLFAMCESPWNAYQFSSELMPEYIKNQYLKEEAVLNISKDVLSQTIHTNSTSRAPLVVVNCLARHLTSFLLEADQLYKDLEVLDAAMSAQVAEMMHFIRRMICLPSGISTFEQFAEQSGRRQYMPGKPLAMVRQLLDMESGGTAGKESARVHKLAEQFKEIVDSLGESTPGSAFLNRLLKVETFTEIGNTLLVLPDGMTESLVDWLRDTEQVVFQDNLDTTNGKSGLDMLLPSLHHYQKTYLMLPRWDAVGRLLASHNVPEILHLVCDEATAVALKHQAGLLRNRPSFRIIHERLDRFIAALDEAMSGISTIIPLIEDVRLPQVPVSRYEGEGRPVVLTLADGRVIQMFEGSSVIQYRHEFEPRPFRKVQATSLNVGCTVFPIDEDYIALAEGHSLFCCNAGAALKIYHQQIIALRDKLPGEKLQDKAAYLRKKMAGTVVELPEVNTIQRWLDVDNLIDAPLETVCPHAPYSEAWFNAFAVALDMMPSIASMCWKFGIYDIRSRRISAGFSTSRFCTALLTEPDSVIKYFSGDNDDLLRLEKYARNALSEIIDIRSEVSK